MRDLIATLPAYNAVELILAPELGGSGAAAEISIGAARQLAAMLVQAADQAERVTRSASARDVAVARQAIAEFRAARIGRARAA